MKNNTADNLDWIKNVRSTYAMGIAFSMGLEDALSAFALSFTLIFIYFLVYIVKSKGSVLFCSVIFLFVQAVMVNALVHGRLDIFLTQGVVYDGIRIFYWIIAFVFLMMGVLYFRDWWVLRMGKEDSKQVITFPDIAVNKKLTEVDVTIKIFANVFFWVASAFIGAISVFMISICLQDYPMFIMLVNSSSEKEFLEAQRAIIVYGNGFIIINFVFCILAFCYCSILRLRQSLSRTMSLVKVLCSAVFVSLSVSIVILLLRI